MTKQEFLNALNRKLKKLKKAERKKYIELYEENIADIMERGVSEEAAVEKMGSADNIANEILSGADSGSFKNRDWKAVTLIVSSGILLVYCMASFIVEHIAMKRITRADINHSVAIIGGADGPTSIFLAGKFTRPWGWYMVTGIVVIVTAIYLIRKHKQHRKHLNGCNK